MTSDRLKRFRFRTDAQWKSCLIVQADPDVLSAGGGLQPFAAYARPATLYPSSGAHAPAVTRAGEILWHDTAGCLHRICPGAEAPETSPGPRALGTAKRIVANSSGLWVIGESAVALERYDEDSLTRVMTVDVPGDCIADIADGGAGAVMALVKSGSAWQAVRVDPGGHVAPPVPLEGISHAWKFVFLPRSRRFVVLVARPHRRLYWYGEKGGHPTFSVAAAALHPCFKASMIASDRNDRIFVAGRDGTEFGGGSYVLIRDGDGNALGEIPLDARPTGVAAARGNLLVTGLRGLQQFAPSKVVPQDAQPVSCTVVTPMLNAPDREDRRRWLRIDAMAGLPEGSTLEISFAATGDADARDRLNRIIADERQTATQRVAALLSEPDVWRPPTEFHGSDAPIGAEPAAFAAKLFDVREPYVWVCVTVRAAAGARLPSLSELAVLYPGRTLMENLPGIYQAEEDRPDSFLRSLVGVLEATTQGIDARIGSMAGYLDPSTAPSQWLDFVARWLGVPWDDAFSVEQKRRVLAQAAVLAGSRGTRAGLETLLDALMPGSPRRFRVLDPTADVGFAFVGGDGCAGSALPTMLGGRTRWSAELDARAVIGYLRLPCPNQLDDGVWQLAGKIRVDVAASGPERRAWEPWLASVIADMVPLTARVELRWVTPQALRADRLDGTLTLDAPPTPHLGTDAVTGITRLPERPPRLSASGASMGTRLR